MFALSTALQNTLLYSEQLNLWTATFVTVTANQALGPNGTLTADLVEDLSAVATGSTQQTVSGSAFNPDTAHTASGYFEKDDIPRTTRYVSINLFISNGVTQASVNAYLDTKTGEHRFDGGGLIQGGVEHAGKYWRLWVSGQGSDDCTQARVSLYPARGEGDEFQVNSTTQGSAHIWGGQLNEGASPTPYIETDTINEQGPIEDFVSLDLEYSFKEKKTKLESVGRAKAGDQYRYLWGSYNKLELPVEYVSSVSTKLINGFWTNNTEIIFSNDVTAESIAVKVMNKTKPIDKLNKPYFDQYKGKILLETF